MTTIVYNKVSLGDSEQLMWKLNDMKSQLVETDFPINIEVDGYKFFITNHGELSAFYDGMLCMLGMKNREKQEKIT